LEGFCGLHFGTLLGGLIGALAGPPAAALLGVFGFMSAANMMKVRTPTGGMSLFWRWLKSEV
jgi:hypothetical protein